MDTADASIPLDPTMPVIDGFRAVLGNLCDVIMANWQGAIDQENPEFLHDLRIGVRQTRTVLGRSKGILPISIRKAAQLHFDRLSSLTGPVRDLDVFLIKWDNYIDPLDDEVVDALEQIHTHLIQRHQTASVILVQAMRSADTTDIMTTWHTWLHEPMPASRHGTYPQRALGKVIKRQIVHAQARVLKRGRRIRPKTEVARIHQLRKDAKKLRYLLECFNTLFVDAPRNEFIRRLKELQNTLGEHQDLAIHIAELRSIANDPVIEGKSSETLVAIGRLIELLNQRQHVVRSECEERFATYAKKETQTVLKKTLAKI